MCSAKASAIEKHMPTKIQLLKQKFAQVHFNTVSSLRTLRKLSN